MRVQIRSVTGQTIVIGDVDPEGDIRGLKHLIEKQENLPADLQRLIMAGHERGDDTLLASCGIVDDSILHLVVRQGRPLSDEALASMLQEQENERMGIRNVNIRDAPQDADMVNRSEIVQLAGADTAIRRRMRFHQEYVNVMELLHIASSLMMSCTIEILGIFLFQLPYQISMTIVILSVVMPLVAMFGAKSYRPFFVLLFAAWIILYIGVRIFLIITVTPFSALFFATQVAGGAFELFNLMLCVRFAFAVKKLIPDEIHLLRAGTHPVFDFLRLESLVPS